MSSNISEGMSMLLIYLSRVAFTMDLVPYSGRNKSNVSKRILFTDHYACRTSGMSQKGWGAVLIVKISASTVENRDVV